MEDEAVKKVIIALELESDKYTKAAVEAKKEVLLLNEAQKALKKSGNEASVEFQKNTQRIAELNKEIRDNNKAASQINQLNKDNISSTNDMAAAVGILTKELNSKTKEELENTQSGRDLVATTAALNQSLRDQGKAVNDDRRNVGNYSGAFKDLRDELKAAKAEMVGIASTLGMQSKEFQQAATKAGKLQDELDDVNAATKAMATGSDLGKFKNQLGEIGKSLGDLDFKEAGEKAKALGGIVKNFSWSGMVQGAKGLATTLGEVGLAMLELPIVWIAAAIAAIVVGIKMWTDASHENAKEQIENVDKLQERYEAYKDFQIKLAKLLGQETEKLEIQKLKTLQKFNDLKIKQLQAVQESMFGMNDEEKKQMEELKNKRQDIENEIYLTYVEQAVNKQKLDDKVKKERDEKEKKEKEERDAKNKKLLDEQSAQAQKERDEQNKNSQQLKSEESKRREDRELAESVESEKLLIVKSREAERLKEISEKSGKTPGDTAALHNALIDLELKYNEDLRQLNLKAYNEKAELENKGIDEDEKRKEDAAQKEKDNKRKHLADDLKDDKKNYDDKKKELDDALQQKLISNIEYQEQLTHITREETDKRKKIEEDAKAAGIRIMDDLIQIQNNRFEKQIIQSNKERDTKIANLDAQLAAGVISQQQYDQQKAKIEADAHKKEADLKKKQFRMEQAAAVAKVAINTAEAISKVYGQTGIYGIAAEAIPIAVGVAETALILSKPVPEFAGGGKAISGKKIKDNDGLRIARANGDNLLATVKTGEVILNERQQRALGGDRTFKSIGVPGFADGGFAIGAIATPVENRFDSINDIISFAKYLPTPIVLVEDINSAQSQHQRVTAAGTL